jgi:hypothetical protein
VSDMARNMKMELLTFSLILYQLKNWRSSFVSRSNYIILDGSARTGTLGFFTNGLPAMKNPDALRIFFPECFGGKYKSLKKHNSRRIIS